MEETVPYLLCVDMTVQHGLLIKRVHSVTVQISIQHWTPRSTDISW